MTDQEDYTAGEQNNLQATPKKNPSPAGVQWHMLTYLGAGWGKAKPSGPPRFSDQELIECIRTVNAQGGVVTLDVPHACGKVNPACLQQLIAIRRAIRGDVPPGPGAITVTWQ